MSTKLGEFQNEEKKGVFGQVILRNLKRLGLTALDKASTMGLGALFGWFMRVIGLDT